MKMKKKLVALLAVLAVLCMSLTGCGQKLEPADQTIAALFELSAKGNAAPMMELLGYESEEDVFNAFFEDGAAVLEDTEIIDELVSEFADMGLEISDEELQEFSDVMTAQIEKITYTTEIKSEEKDTVVVTVKVNGLSSDELEQIMYDAADAMAENLTENLTEEEAIAIMAGDMSVITPYMEQYLKDVIAGISEMEIVAEPYEFDVTCEKLSVEVGSGQTVAWLPSDMTGFENNVEASIYQ